MDENQTNNSSPAKNDWANTSFWLGICSLLPYAIVSVINYTEIIPDSIFSLTIYFLGLFFCVFWGIAIGATSLVSGIAGVWQIRVSQGMEIGSRSAMLGIVLGILAIIFNILICNYLVAGFMLA